jgi:HTH-type transcriptional regulator / antitoxin HipB
MGVMSAEPRKVAAWRTASDAREGAVTPIVVSIGVRAPHVSSLTPMAVSTSEATSNPDPVLAARGLPDFSALLAAELGAAAAPPIVAPSSLSVGELVLSARELSGSSQRALASRAGTSQAAVTAIETGNRLPTVRSLIRLVEAARLELVLGLRRPGGERPVALGALVSNTEDGLADYFAMVTPAISQPGP